MKRIQKKNGILAFEWILVCVALTIGVIGGLVAVRNAFLGEIDDTINVVQNIDAEFIRPVDGNGRVIENIGNN